MSGELPAARERDWEYTGDVKFCFLKRRMFSLLRFLSPDFWLNFKPGTSLFLSPFRTTKCCWWWAGGQ